MCSANSQEKEDCEKQNPYAHGMAELATASQLLIFVIWRQKLLSQIFKLDGLKQGEVNELR